ncbi:MAG: hypothetical protein EBS61_01275 [Betaproteobacteria bacterium]|nr:hypothetical protein [Betaproteobacteria bacterium]
MKPPALLFQRNRLSPQCNKQRSCCIATKSLDNLNEMDKLRFVHCSISIKTVVSLSYSLIFIGL